MHKLLLIDGNAIVHRAYHAIPPLNNSKGEPINAVYGFFSMFFSVIQDQKPYFLTVCFDRPAPNFRQTLFAGYQQHRPALSDDFVPQIILVHELLERMKVKVFELDGYEADDLIGTISTNARAQNKDLEIIILTGDRDLLQLVNGRVKLLMPLVGISKTSLMGSREVEEKYGVTPSQFVDYKALIGDASDGYPGVAGIGPKTASSLLREYKSFDNLYKHLNSLPEKTALKLATDAEQAALAKKLAAIVTDAPIQYKLQESSVKNFDLNALKQEFSKHDFKSLLVRLDKLFNPEPEKLTESASDIKESLGKKEKQMELF